MTKRKLAEKADELMDLDETTSWRWESLDLLDYPEVQKYLGRDEVAAVELPKVVGGDKTYPGLILDGASGVGKTQQAFALLNDGKQQLVYFLLIDGSLATRQDIYQEMTSMTGMPGFLQMVDSARTAVSAHTFEQGKDPFSATNLYALCNSKIAPLDALIHFIADRILKYDQEDLKKISWTISSEKRTVANSIKHLTKKVLFLDEVLPPPTSSNESSEDAPARLRFIRNLGRALRMRVVMAGTAATAANMISYQQKGANASAAASREGRAERGWMEIQFIWIPVPLPALFGPNVYTAHTERPYLRSLLEDMPAEPDSVKIFMNLAKQIDEDKKLTNGGKLIWLSGCWLAPEGSTLPSSPFAIGPADLVKGHFFEPALAIIHEKGRRKPEEPHMGRGTKPKRRIKGPLRIALQLYQHKGIIWWALLSPNKKAGYSEDFKGVESALTHCVQSCLGTEPILAISLSISHHFTPDEFANTFSKLWKETPMQQSRGAMDGELNEFLMFAALQMACRAGDGADFPNTRSAVEMVGRLWDYLSPAQPHLPPPEVVDEVMERSGYTINASKKFIPPTRVTYFYGRDGKGDEDLINNRHKKTKMPWLVPAGSHKELQDKIHETHRGGRPLFADPSYCIAGLVPGVTNSSLDASAFLWKGEDYSNAAPLEWVFEFKGRSDSYSLNEATDDLVDKCDNAFKDTTNDIDKPKSHAMLVALTGSIKSECCIWLEDEKLRIVVLIGSRLV